MTIYKINVKNNSPVDKNILVFSKVPDTQGTDVNKVFSTVFLTSPIGSGATVTFEIDQDVYAVAGTHNITASAVISQSVTSDPMALATATGKGTTVLLKNNAGATSFPKPYPPATAATPGSFQILTGDDFKQGSSTFLGLGRSGGSSGAGKTVNTVAVWQASPQTTVTVVPHLEFYVVMGTQVKGTVVDVTTLGKKGNAAFTSGATEITLTYLDSGDWS